MDPEIDSLNQIIIDTGIIQISNLQPSYDFDQLIDLELDVVKQFLTAMRIDTEKQIRPYFQLLFIFQCNNKLNFSSDKSKEINKYFEFENLRNWFDFKKSAIHDNLIQYSISVVESSRSQLFYYLTDTEQPPLGLKKLNESENIILDDFIRNLSCNTGNKCRINNVKTSSETNITNNIEIIGGIVPTTIKNLLTDYRIVECNNMLFSYPVKTRLKISDINEKRSYIYTDILSRNNINDMVVSKELIENIYLLYNEVFFNGKISKMVKKNRGNLVFSVSNRMSSTAGLCLTSGCNYEIRMSAAIFSTVKPTVDNPRVTNGVICTDMLSALLITFEHELTHLIVRLTKPIVETGNRIYSSHGYYYKDLVNALFGHLEIKHDLLGDGESASISEIQASFEKGKNDFVDNQEVVFKHRDTEVIGYVLKRNNKTVELVTNDKIARYNYKYVHNNGNIIVKSNEFITQFKNRILNKLNYSSLTKDDFRVGEQVKFKHKNKFVNGKIKKLNPKKAKVNVKGLIYTVPYLILEKN